MHLKYIHDKDEPILLKVLIIEKLKISRKLLLSIKYKNGKLLVNNEEVTVRYYVKKNDIVEIIFPDEKISESLVPEDIKIDIVYEDDYLIVIDKQKGIPCIPSKRHPSKTLANAILYYYQQNNIKNTVHFVNRLDKDTSGLLIVAKTRFIHNTFKNELATIERKYIAVINGDVNLYGTIETNIKREAENSIKRIVSDEGQNAVTHYKTIEKVNGFTFIELKLETGRTHQIRVHLSSLGYPIVGDELYGGDCSMFNGQLLHCYSLNFTHPITKIKINLKSNYIDKIKKALE